MILKFNQLNESNANDIRSVKDIFLDIDDDLNFIEKIFPVKLIRSTGLFQGIKFNSDLQSQILDLELYKSNLEKLKKIYDVLDRMSKFMDYSFILKGDTITFSYPFGDNIKEMLNGSVAKSIS